MRAVWLAAGILCATLVSASSFAAPQYTYDQLGRLQSATYDNGVQIIYNYDAAGNRTSVTTQTGNNLGPVANPDTMVAPSISPPQQTTIDPRTNDYSPQGYSLTVTGVSAATSGQATTSFTGGSVGYTPNSGYAGSDTFTYTISDGHSHAATATVFVTVGVPPVANNDQAQVSMNTGQNPYVNISVLANDVQKLYPFSLQSVGTPSHGTATNNGDGTVKYSPALNFVGVDNFSYTIVDTKGETASATVFVTVGNPPVALPDLAGVPVGQTSVRYPPLVNDSDPYGLALTIVSTTSPSQGSVAINGDSTLTYTATGTPPYLDTFQYTISNGGLTASAQDSICVGTQAPIAPNQELLATATEHSTNFYPTGTLQSPLPALTVSCSQPGSTITAVSQGARGGTVSVTQGGTVIYYTYYEKVGSGTWTNVDSFNYTITDPYGVTASGVVTVDLKVICIGC